MANVKISALTTLPGNAVSGNDLFLITQLGSASSRSLSVANSRIAISDANDYSTYLTAKGGVDGANSSILNLQSGLAGANTSIINLDNQSNNNAYITWLAASANDGTTLGYAYSNDYSTYSVFLGAFAGSNASIVNLRTGLDGANTSASSSNLALLGGISGANTSILNLQTGLIGSNAAILNLQTGLDGANVYSNALQTRVTAVEANSLSLQSGLTGANTLGASYSSNIANLQTGLVGTNNILSSNISIFTGAFVGSNNRISNTEANVISLQSGLSGANTSIAAITSAPVTFQSDVSIRGNLILTGNTTIVNANTISFGDSLLSLAANNIVSDSIDIGLYGHYWNGSANSHTGIFRSAVSKDWMIFSNYTTDLEGNSTIVISNSSFALGNLRVKSANASQDVSAANSVLSTSIYSNGVELRANDYATYLMAKGPIDSSNTAIINLQTGLTGTNTTVATKDSVANVYATYLAAMANDYVTLYIARSNDFTTLYTAFSNDYSTYTIAKGGIDAANTSIINLQGGLSGSNTRLSGAEANVIALQGGLAGTNTTVATKDSIANVYATYLQSTSNDYVTYTRLYANVNSVQANLAAYATYANTAFGAGAASNGTLAYVFANYVTTTSNSYYIGTPVTSVNNVQVYIDGVYQSKNSYILDNASSNIKFLDATVTAGRQLNLETLAIFNVNGVNAAALEANVASLQGGIAGTNAKLSANVAIFTGAFTGSNTRVSGAESNVIALQGGIAGANTAIALRANVASPTLTGNVLISGLANVNYVGTDSAVSITGSATRGGAGYHDFLRVNNGGGGTNPNKYFRINSTGGIEILNNAYSATIMTLSDSGKIFLNQAATTSNDPITNYLSFNDNACIYDDGNYHIHARGSGSNMWINTNGGVVAIGAQVPVSGGAAATGVTMGSSATIKAYLSVYGSKTYTIGSYGYTAQSGTGTGAGTTAPYSIYSDNRMNASEFDATSDERAKDIQGIIPLETAINFVKNIDGIHYTWNADAVEHNDNTLKAGFGAQTVHKAGFDHMIGVIPNEKLKEQVDEDGWVHPEGMQLTMGYNQAIPYHHQVIKHLLNKIEDLEKRLNEMSSK